VKLLFKEGTTYLLILAGLAIVLFFIHPLLVAIPAIVFVFLAFFFRDPVRIVPVPESGVTSFLSPADGKILVIDEVEDGYLFRGRAKMVTIFLSPLDVHVNRTPIAGEVVAVEHRKGRFRPAYLAEAPSVNERNYIVVRNEYTQCLLVQIVGVLARRVVCWAKPGDTLAQGEKFGLMKFGSSMQVFMPVNTEIKVENGARVIGGETVIGVITHDPLD
jgi:phosphatidylserine decarboxylase